MRRFALAALLFAPAPGLAQRHGGAGHAGGIHARGGGGGGIPCGRSYISASKTCHVGTADVHVRAPRDSSTSAWSNSYAPARPTPPVTYADVVAALDSNARANCRADSVAAATGQRPRAPQCLRSTATVSAEEQARIDVRSTLQDQRRTLSAPLRLLGSPTDTAATVILVPQGGTVEVSSCMVGAGAWCFASYGGHGGYTPRHLLTGERAIRADSVPSAARHTRAHTRLVHPAGSRYGTAGHGHPGYYLGPRGGCYTYSASGRKRYVDHSYCA